MASLLVMATIVMPTAPPGSSGCTSVPRDVSGMTVAEAIARTPNLSTLAGVIAATDLPAHLNRAAEVTVFAPADEALRDIAPPAVEVLRYHLVPRRVDPEHLAGVHPTLHGAQLEVTGHDAAFLVNEQAALICTRMKALNGNVYLIDAVLTPR